MSYAPNAPENPLCQDNVIDTLSHTNAVVTFLRDLETWDGPLGTPSTHLQQRLTLARYDLLKLIGDALEFAQELASHDRQSRHRPAADGEATQLLQSLEVSRG